MSGREKVVKIHEPAGNVSSYPKSWVMRESKVKWVDYSVWVHLSRFNNQRLIFRLSISSSVSLLPLLHPSHHQLHRRRPHHPFRHRYRFHCRYFRVQSHILQRRRSLSLLGSLHRQTPRLRRLNRGLDGRRRRWIGRRFQGLL